MKVTPLLNELKPVDPFIKDQLKRASLSITLNIAEGNGRERKADKGYFFTVSRSSFFECVAILDVMKISGVLGEDKYKEFYHGFEEISKMLIGLKKSLQQNS